MLHGVSFLASALRRIDASQVSCYIGHIVFFMSKSVYRIVCLNLVDLLYWEYIGSGHLIIRNLKPVIIISI